MWISLRFRAPRILALRVPRHQPAVMDRAETAVRPEDLRTVVLTFRRADLDALEDALTRSLGSEVAVDSPARLAAALGRAIRDAGGHGAVEVRRSPGAIRMPDLWTVRVSGADRSALATLESLVR
jgi:hypothetical protein